MSNKFSFFQSLVYSCQPSIFAVTETWLSDSHYDGEILPTGYNIFRKDRGSRGGGVLLVIDNCFSATLLPSPSSLEVLTVRINTTEPVLVSVVYVPPSIDSPSFDSLLSYLGSLFSSGERVFVMGDFNCPDIQWSTLSCTSPLSAALCDFVFDLNIYQAVESPTHTMGNVLDLVLTNSADLLTNITTSTNCCTSDHFIVKFAIHLPSHRPAYIRSSSFYDYSRADLDGLCNFLLDCDFHDCYLSSDVEDVWLFIKSAIEVGVSYFVPMVSGNRRYSSLPKWFNPSLRHDLNCLRTTRRKVASHPTPYLVHRLKEDEAKLQFNINEARCKYESGLVQDFAFSKPSRLYSYINSLKNHGDFPLSMFFLADRADSDAQKAELFNRFFFSVYSNPSPSPVPSDLPHPSSSCLVGIEFTSSDIYHALASLNPTKSMGPDGISPLVLKSCACALADPLYHLFNCSLRSSTIPQEWKLHRISPIFKSGDKSLVSNYRPISLLCIVSKLFEQIIYDKIIDFISPKLSLSQFGFLRGKSTNQQLLSLLNIVHNNLDHRSSTDVIYLDIKKAFDSVSHSKLLYKLWSFGITGRLWSWFQAYLSNRSQMVVINGAQSGILPVTSGVPQGSVLGPLLFLIFINDLPQSLVSVVPLIFADDTKCIQSVYSSFDEASLQKDLNSLHAWSENNMLCFNTLKSYHMRFPSSPESVLYYLNNQAITTRDQVRDLGVWFSNDLSWSKHISHITSKAYQSLYLIRRSFNSALLPTHVRKALYVSLVRSHLTYCSVIWRPQYQRDILQLERVQRRATKWILSDYHSDYKSRLLALDLLPVMMVYELADLSFFLKSFHSPTPNFNIMNFVSFCSGVTRSSSLKKLRIPFNPSNRSRHFYFSRLPRLWNSLPPLDPSSSVSSNVTLIKKFFLDKFISSFNPSLPCTFHYHCPCGNCFSFNHCFNNTSLFGC